MMDGADKTKFELARIVYSQEALTVFLECVCARRRDDSIDTFARRKIHSEVY